MTAPWIVFFTACILQSIGFVMLVASLGANGRGRDMRTRARFPEERRMSAAPGPVPVKACVFLAAGSLLMLGYAAWSMHLILFAGQAIFTVFMGLTVRRHHQIARMSARAERE